MIGKVYSAPKSVFESGQFIVVGRESCEQYNPTRKAWFLQVREYRDGQAFGGWVGITRREFVAWNPNVVIPEVDQYVPAPKE